jgi:hypothetical protein
MRSPLGKQMHLLCLLILKYVELDGRSVSGVCKHMDVGRYIPPAADADKPRRICPPPTPERGLKHGLAFSTRENAGPVTCPALLKVTGVLTSCTHFNQVCRCYPPVY